MHDEVDGAATTVAATPVHKLQASDRKAALGGMPFLVVTAIRAGTTRPQYRGQGTAQRVELIGPEIDRSQLI